ncbi:MAG: hypothetical protein WCI50_09530 [Actinomycetes bacterium]
MTVGRSFAVGVVSTEYVDSSRPTSASGSYPGAPSRTFPVTVWYPAAGTPGPAGTATPDATPDRGDGPYPLVFFAHGYAVTPEFSVELLTRWAAAGYVVAAPTFPLLSGLPAGPDHVDYAKSFADTTFVLTSLLQPTTGAPGSSLMAGLVDPGRIALAGHSDGEAVAFGTGFLVCCRDRRVTSVIALAGILGNVNAPVVTDSGLPILHLTGTADEFQSYDRAVAWDRENLGAPHWTIGLIGGTHAPPYRDPTSPYFAGVVSMSVAFLDGTLKDRPDRLDAISAAVAAEPRLFRQES